MSRRRSAWTSAARLKEERDAAKEIVSEVRGVGMHQSLRYFRPHDSEPEGPSMLCVRDLVKVYPGGVAALQGVSLEIGPGLFGLLGPNGAGKSTFMKILAGLLEPTSGEVTLDGEDVVARPQRVWGKLGYLPQDFGFYPHLSGEAMLAYLLRLKGVRPP